MSHDRLVLLLLIKGFKDGIGPEEDPSFEEVGNSLCELIFGEDGDWHAEDLIEFFKCSLFGFALRGQELQKS